MTVKPILFFLTIILIHRNSLAQTPTFAGKPIVFYLQSNQVAQRAKDIYTGKVKVSDDDQTLALMDSLFTTNATTRPFYFLVLTGTMKKADGAYSEPLGLTAKQFVENKTHEFIKYFTQEPLLTQADFEQWASQVAGEIKISEEGNEAIAAAQFKKTVYNNCSACTQQEKQRLMAFLNFVQKYSL